jgi:hypothetical protein
VLSTAGVSFQDAAESDLRARSSGRRPSSKDALLMVAGGSVLVMVLLGGILALALLDWMALASSGGISSARRATGENGVAR